MPELEPVPEDWTRGLAVVAHPDDLEYGAASAIARWTDQGKEVVYCLVTSGEAGIDSVPPDACARIRQAEERASAAAVGVDTVEFSPTPMASSRPRSPCGEIWPRPSDATAPRSSSRSTSANRSDSPASTTPTTATRVPRCWTPSVTPQTVAVRRAAARSGVRSIFGTSPQPARRRHPGSLDRGIASLEAHRTYLDALPEGTTGTDPDEFLRAMATQAGPRLGVDLATTFELIPLG